MSDADTNTKSSLNSETDSAENENERLQWMLVEQQKHLLSEYQNNKNSTGGENEGKCCDFSETPKRNEMTKSQSLLNDIKERTEEDNYSASSDLRNSKNVNPSATEALESQQLSRPLICTFSLETTLSSSEEIQKQKHIEESFAGRKIFSQGIADDSNQGKSTPALDVPLVFSHSSRDSWRRLEQELQEYFADFDMQDESRPLAATTAQLKSPPETFVATGYGADSTHVRLGGSVQLLPQSRLDGEHHHNEEIIDDRKLLAASQDDDDDDDDDVL